MKKNLLSIRFFVGAFGVAALLFLSQAQVLAATDDLNNVVIKQKQILQINKTLRNVIEENQRLTNRNQELKEQVSQLKTRGTDFSRYDTLKRDRELFAKNYNSGEQVIVRQRMGQKNDVILLASADKKVQSREEKTLDLLNRIDAFTEEDEQLRLDSAKAHYNMGNIYYQKGEYEIAAREYYQAITLMPNDSDAHYNLAFVSGEHLRDFKTALKHYRMYLYLKPEAKDRSFVRDKIIHAELVIKSIVDSPLDKDK